MKIFLKLVFVLLVSAFIVFSSVGIAETVKEAIPLVSNIDVEKYVYDEKNQEWVDADYEQDALDVPICNEVTFKIVIHNNGDEPIFNLHVSDGMVDSLEFVSADPNPIDFQHNPPFYNMFWLFPGPLVVGEDIEIYITAHVNGPECSSAYNSVEVFGTDENGTVVTDTDYCFVHAIKLSREFFKTALVFLDCHPYLFPFLQKIIRQLSFGI